ncbi:MAG: hypothetical protein HMLKMBBP_03712 [Planctomycetes bacterium]|nr:hypothetical protein [Planctomycetota bacterium]
MTSSFGLPPASDKFRTLVKDRRDEARDADGEKVTIEWRGQPTHLYVISVPVELLYYNPSTHRIRAQVSLDPAKERALHDHPWSSEAQEYLEKLLKCQPSNPDVVDPDFIALRDNIKQFGQKEPGIITRDGILVNGNTRRAALRDLGRDQIRVGVLPDSAAWDDVNSVELALQLRKDHRREYSYINRLLAVEEQLAAGRREDDVARDFHIKTPTLRQDRWVYGVIREMIERSRTDGGAALRLIDFEDHQEKLRELFRAYDKLESTDRDAAQLLKEARLALIVLERSKTDVRYAEVDFIEKYLEPKLPPELKLTPPDSPPVAIPGLGISVPAEGARVKAAKALTDRLLKARATVLPAAGVDPGSVSGAKALIEKAEDAFGRALDSAGRDYSLKKRKVAPVERLSDACDQLDLCIEGLANSAAARAIDDVGFDDTVIRLRKTLARLAKQARRTIPEPGDGMAWLLDATKDGQ